VFNILDYSSVVFPIGTVKETDTWAQYPRASKVPLSEEDGVYEMYYGDGKLGPEKYEGAPVSLQLISRRYREEEVLEMLKRILQNIRKAESK
jgi:amidase